MLLILVSMLYGVNRKAEVRPKDLQWVRRTGRILAALAVGSSLLAGATATAASAATTPRAATAPSGARALTVNTATERQLLPLYAAYRHIPGSDIARVESGMVHVARTSNGTEWALLGFTPSSSAPLSVRVSFQDAANLGVFTRQPGRNWKITGLGRPELACDASIPASVRRSWGYDNCPAAGASATTAPAASYLHRASASAAAASGTTSQIASLANEYVGIQDTPASTDFSDNCNPFTYFENPAASDAGCGIDPTFNVQDHNEDWCADFTKYVWSQAGVTGPLSDLTPGAASFYAYGYAEGESMPVDPPVSDAQVGDAMVLYEPGTTPNSGSADHVAVITGVDDSAGTIDTVNGDMPWSSAYIGVSTSGYLTPQAFATDAEGPAGEEWIFVSPQAPAAAPVTSMTEFEDAQDNLYGYNYNVTAGTGTNDQTGLGMATQDGPSTAVLSDGSYITAFQDAEGDLYLHPSTGTNISTGLGMALDTSPAVAALSSDDDYITVFQDTQGYLYLHTSAGANTSTGLGMALSTSPAIAASGSSWVVAFQANNNHLYIKTSGGVQKDMGLGMMPYTNPAITTLADGGFAVAFQANTGLLYTYVTSGTSAAAIADGTETDSKLGMDDASSPAIAAGSSSTWKVAFETNTDYLYLYSSAGAETTSGLGMFPETSPSITVEPDGSTYLIAFEDGQGDLYLHSSTGTNDPTGLGMDLSSPSIAAQ